MQIPAGERRGENLASSDNGHFARDARGFCQSGGGRAGISYSLRSNDPRRSGDRSHRARGGFRQGRKGQLKGNNAMDLGNGLGHLTYSTLVHPGDNWEQMWASLNTYLPKVKARFAGNKPFGVSLRLSADSAQTLVNSQAERDRLKKFLADHDMYLYTVNAFPY